MYTRPIGFADRFGCSNRGCSHPTYKRRRSRSRQPVARHLVPSIRVAAISYSGRFPRRGERYHAASLRIQPAIMNELLEGTGRTPLSSRVRRFRGDIARSLFYMHVEYDLSLKGMLPMLKRWNRLDPPNALERWRNNEIGKLEGIRNKFIDSYLIADHLQ
jgi:hypothetical protein